MTMFVTADEISPDADPPGELVKLPLKPGRKIGSLLVITEGERNATEALMQARAKTFDDIAKIANDALKTLYQPYPLPPLATKAAVEKLARVAVNREKLLVPEREQRMHQELTQIAATVNAFLKTVTPPVCNLTAGAGVGRLISVAKGQRDRIADLVEMNVKLVAKIHRRSTICDEQADRISALERSELSLKVQNDALEEENRELRKVPQFKAGDEIKLGKIATGMFVMSLKDRDRLARLDALLGSEEPPEGLVEYLGGIPGWASAAWRWFRETLAPKPRARFVCPYDEQQCEYPKCITSGHAEFNSTCEKHQTTTTEPASAAAQPWFAGLPMEEVHAMILCGRAPGSGVSGKGVLVPEGFLNWLTDRHRNPSEQPRE